MNPVSMTIIYLRKEYWPSRINYLLFTSSEPYVTRIHLFLSLTFYLRTMHVFRDHSREVMIVVSHSRWSLNAGSIRYDLRRVVVSEQWFLKAGGL